MADIVKFLRKYSNYQTTFKITSYDDTNDISLCTDETVQNIDFDKIIADKYPNPMECRPKSFDAIYVYGDNIYCVEFKNERKPDKKELEQKLLDGKKELENILSELNIQKNDYKFIYCVVYNIFKPIEERWKRGILKYPIKMHLEKHKENGFVDDIFTEDVEFFASKLKSTFDIDMKC